MHRGECALTTLEQQFYTDESNVIHDSQFGVIGDPRAVATRPLNHPAVVEYGLFIGLVSDVIVSGAQGVRDMTRSE